MLTTSYSKTNVKKVSIRLTIRLNFVQSEVILKVNRLFYLQFIALRFISVNFPKRFYIV